MALKLLGLKLEYIYYYLVLITDLILVVVRLLKRDINRLVVEARDMLELVELWDKG